MIHGMEKRERWIVVDAATLWVVAQYRDPVWVKSVTEQGTSA